MLAAEASSNCGWISQTTWVPKLVMGWMEIPIRMPVIEHNTANWLNASIWRIYNPRPHETDSEISITASQETSFTWCLKVRTVITSLCVGKPANEAIAMMSEVCGFTVVDCVSNGCGRVQLTRSVNFLVGSTQKFILIKDSKFGEEYSSSWDRLETASYNRAHTKESGNMSIDTRWLVDANNLERPYYIVMMVRPVSEADSHGVEGAMERVGIGMIYKRGVSRAFDATLDMEEVRLI